MQFWRPVLLLAAGLTLTGCATYVPLPLPQRAELAASTPLLTVPVTEFETPGVRIAHVDMRRPLNAAAVAALAVLNDPTLLAARAQRGVAAAQSYAAGLLPWPEVTLGAGRPDTPDAQSSNPWSLSLDQNLAALLQHGAIERAARASQTRVRLDVIWDEWQVAQHARILYADLEVDETELRALTPLLQLYTDHVQAARMRESHDDVSQNSALNAQATYASLVSQLSTLQVRHAKDMAALRGLLGLSPHAPLMLVLNDHPTLMAPDHLAQAITALPHRRPDLMALAAAYKGADEHVRQAILAQFPLIGVSIHRERDTEGAITNGLSLTLTLPFLNDARGEIAVARATRQALHSTYQARLDAATLEVTALSEAAIQLNTQLTQLQQTLGRLPNVPRQTLTSVPFDTLSTYLYRRDQIAAEIARLQGNLDQAVIALDTLLGLPLDTPAGDHTAVRS